MVQKIRNMLVQLVLAVKYVCGRGRRCGLSGSGDVGVHDKATFTDPTRTHIW